MANFNKVILAGNLTRDPEMRYLPKGTAVASFGLAINRRWKSETGEAKEEVTFVDIEAFGKQAEVICQYVKKGQQFLVEGRLKLDQWEDKNTHQKVSKLRVVLEGFSFIGSRGGDAPNSGPPSSSSRPPSSPAPAGPSEPAEGESPAGEQDDVPF